MKNKTACTVIFMCCFTFFSKVEAACQNTELLKNLFEEHDVKVISHNKERFFQDLCPKFHAVLYSLEKLDFLLHKEFSNLLYTRYKKKDLFALAGFNNQQQGHYNQSCGYRTKDYYQFLGGIGDVKSVSILGALGAAESKVHTHPNQAQAHYDTFYATVGFKKQMGKFQLGLEALSGYSFISSKKETEDPALTMRGKNHALFGSFEAKGTYKVLDDNTSLEPYDALSVFYSHESSYKEKGDSGFSLRVQDENLTVIRNELGFYLNIPCTKSVDLFIDPSWMYEYQLNDGKYKASISSEKLFKIFTMNKLPRNYGRLNLGFYVKGKKIDFAITYIGLWGEKFSSAATSLKLNLKF
jgi:Autotransporter beta-domain